MAAMESEWIDVNNLSRRDLQDALALVPRLPTTVANRILDERPFESDQDLLERVNAGASRAEDRLGKKLAARFRFSALPPPAGCRHAMAATTTGTRPATRTGKSSLARGVAM